MLGRCFILFLLVASTGRSARAEEPDLSTPQSTAKSLFRAVEAQDGPAIIACFYTTTPAEEELAHTYGDMIVAARNLNQAAKAKFGGNGEALGAGMISRDEVAKIDSAELKMNQLTATLALPGQPRPMKFQQTGGKWRLIIADYANATPENLPAQLDLLKKVTAVWNETSADINAGKYPTVDEAEQAIQQKLGAVMIHAAQHPATKPTTRP